MMNLKNINSVSIDIKDVVMSSRFLRKMTQSKIIF